MVEFKENHMAKTVKVGDYSPVVKENFDINNVLLESAFKAFDYYLQRQGKDRAEIITLVDALKADAANIANSGQKKFKVILEG
jgi:ribosomal protein L16/L10AE